MESDIHVETDNRGNSGEEGLVQEGEEYQQDKQMNINDLTPQNGDDNSFHMSQYIEKMENNPEFSKKENILSQKLDEFLTSKTGQPFSAFTGNVFLANKILLLSTFTEFLFQRFDILTLFLSIVIILIELSIFNKKHMYKWLLVLIGSLLLDVLVLLDISPVSYIKLNKKIFIIQAGSTYLESGAGSTLLKFGLLFLLANLFLKLFIGIGLWKMAIENKYRQDEFAMKSSLKYAEEQIEEGDPNILRGPNPRGGINENDSEEENRSN